MFEHVSRAFEEPLRPYHCTLAFLARLIVAKNEKFVNWILEPSDYRAWALLKIELCNTPRDQPVFNDLFKLAAQHMPLIVVERLYLVAQSGKATTWAGANPLPTPLLFEILGVALSHARLEFVESLYQKYGNFLETDVQRLEVLKAALSSCHQETVEEAVMKFGLSYGMFKGSVRDVLSLAFACTCTTTPHVSSSFSFPPLLLSPTGGDSLYRLDPCSH